jgi:hypothetical protein
MSRRTLLSLLFLLPCFGLSALATSASADPLCYSASTVGTVPGSHTVGPWCITPYPYSVACFNEAAGLEPSAGVAVHFCTP